MQFTIILTQCEAMQNTYSIFAVYGIIFDYCEYSDYIKWLVNWHYQGKRYSEHALEMQLNLSNTWDPLTGKDNLLSVNMSEYI